VLEVGAEELVTRLAGSRLAVWRGREVPPNDGGLGLGHRRSLTKGVDREAWSP